MPADHRAIVVDNGSRDGSGELARELGAVVVDEPRRGFGAACQAGLLHAETEVVAFMDCDASLDPRQLVALTARVQALDGPALVLGRRRPVRGAWPPHARAANAMLAAQLRRKADMTLRDLGPMRAAPRTALLDLGLRDRRCGWPLEMVLRAAAAGWVTEELDVSYLRRVGRSKVTGSVRGSIHAARDMRAILHELAPAAAR